MTNAELRDAIRFGKETIDEYKKHGEKVPSWIYERIIGLYGELVERTEGRAQR